MFLFRLEKYLLDYANKKKIVDKLDLALIEIELVCMFTSDLKIKLVGISSML